jgi:hypothetical protein
MPDLLKAAQDNISMVAVHLDMYLIGASFLEIRSFQCNQIGGGKVTERKVRGGRIEKTMGRRNCNKSTFG